MAQVKVRKTTFDILEVKPMESKHHEYRVYKLRHVNTEKTLVHNLTWDNFTLWGRHGGRDTMTTPPKAEVTFLN
jgi:hypothetical protein